MRFIRRAAFGLFMVGLALPATLAGQAQSTTGIIRGSVVSSDGSPVASARIILKETRTNFERTLSTNADGVFAASLLPLGEYDVTARAVGFQETRQTGIRLRVGQTQNLTLTLGSAVALQAIVVAAEEPVVDGSRSESSTRLPEEAVDGLPNNGRNFLNLTLLTPGVAITQGPDGDELSIAGQLGIHNNVSVDGADFNNPFFGEQRGGQRAAFTFNLDAVDEIVVVAQGANAEFGRSSGGFVNVITKSGTNTMSGSAHYFGKFDALSANPFHEDDAGLRTELTPDFSQHQFGVTLGGPIVRDKAFFFLAYDQQEFNDTRQTDPNRGDATLEAFLQTAFGGALANDFGPIDRTNDARAFMAKFDFRLSPNNNLSLKYNHSWSEQNNGTFDVDVWGRSSNAREKDRSHAVNGALSSVLGSNVTNELRFQYSREDRPRPYEGPTFPNGRPFPDTGADFGSGFRWGMPFFIPVEDHDTRVQVLNNVTIASGDHLFKIGGEWNRTETVQTFIGFANGRFIFSSVDGFINYATFGNQYVECADGTSNTTGACPGSSIVGPVELYLQFAGVDGRSVNDAGTQSIAQNELAFYVQDSWQASPSLTLNYGVRWEAQIQPDPITAPADVFFSPLIGTTSMGQRFPSDGTIKSDYGMIQPRLGIVFDPGGTGEQVFRANGGIYYSRIPGLNLASIRSTNGSVGQTIFRNSALTGVLGAPPDYDQLLTPPAGAPFNPDVFVMDENFSNPRTISATVAYERLISNGITGSVTYTHASTDNLTRFINRNDAAFGSPWAGSLAGGNGIGTLTTVESTAKSRYNGITFGLQRTNDPDLNFQINYTLSYDKSDDDNERDPFSFRYAAADNLAPEFGSSDRDQRHRVNGWLMARLPGDFFVNNRVSYYSAQPTSVSCGPTAANPFAAPAGSRAGSPADRVCADGSIIQRNTIRKDNAFFSWDIKFSKPFFFGDRQVELIVDIFNVTNSDNFRDPAATSLLFNFDGTLRSGLGNPREFQVGARYKF